MSWQRHRNALPVTFHPLTKIIDSRGNEQYVYDENTVIKTTCWLFPQRGAKAEVIGQQKINVVRVGIRSDLPDIDIGARATFQGVEWDVVTPPEYHHGAKRHTRHWSLDLRERPNGS